MALFQYEYVYIKLPESCCNCPHFLAFKDNFLFLFFCCYIILLPSLLASCCCFVLTPFLLIVVQHLIYVNTNKNKNNNNSNNYKLAQVHAHSCPYVQCDSRQVHCALCQKQFTVKDTLHDECLLNMKGAKGGGEY